MGFMDDFRKGTEKTRGEAGEKAESEKGWFGRLSTGKQVGLVCGGLIALVIVIAIGSGGEEESDPAGGAVEVATEGPTSAPKDSGIEGVPVPKVAKEIDVLGDPAWEMPSGWTYADLKAWYSEEMPTGQDFRSWSWCDTGGGSSLGEALIYSKGKERILSVNLVSDTPPSVLIGTDNSGPCSQPVQEPAELTPGQENALRAAEEYLNTSSFSKAALINQLTSSYGAGFSKADAKFAVNNVEVDWNEQAVRAAKEYLNTSSFSKAALIDQLSSPYGAQFTPEQARYGVNKAYAGG